ncbi:MAG TPA: hypothetical protein VJC15_01085 [Candidatus Paceibacterota bacterium]
MIHKKEIELSRAEKIVLTMYELSRKQKQNIGFEDLVVALFHKYPDHFHLKGHPEFPDSESVNNAIYHNLKKKGVVTYGNKVFALTDRGLSVGRSLRDITKGKSVKFSSRLPKYVDREIGRIKSLEGLRIFLMTEKEKITDTDFYNYLGVTVRTQQNDFLGRVETMSEVVKEIRRMKEQDAITKRIPEYHRFLMKRFKHLLEAKAAQNKSSKK